MQNQHRWILYFQVKLIHNINVQQANNLIIDENLWLKIANSKKKKKEKKFQQFEIIKLLIFLDLDQYYAGKWVGYNYTFCNISRNIFAQIQLVWVLNYVDMSLKYGFQAKCHDQKLIHPPKEKKWNLLSAFMTKS